MIYMANIRIDKKSHYYSISIAQLVNKTVCREMSAECYLDGFYNESIYYANMAKSCGNGTKWEVISGEGNYDFSAWKLPEQAQKRFVLDKRAHSVDGQNVYYCEY